MFAVPSDLPENAGLAFPGAALRSRLILSETRAWRMLAAANPHGKPNRDVVRPFAGAADVFRRPLRRWAIDFAPVPDARAAALYRLPFARVHGSTRRTAAGRVAGASQVAMRIAIARCSRCVVTAVAGLRRMFAWLPAETLPGRGLVVFARDDDWFFGVLHSHFHEIWTLRAAPSPRKKSSGFRYSPGTSFETFPFPWPPATPLGKLSRTQDELRTAIAQAARALDDARNQWLGDRSDPRRTLTALYSARPAWLHQVHADLDAAVAAAFGWSADLPDDELVARLLALNRVRVAPTANA